MREGGKHPEQERRPIKVIKPNQGQLKKVRGGGPKTEPFREVNLQFRSVLSSQVSAIRRIEALKPGRIGLVPVRVKLIPRALAKSHRPDTLFSESTCPIIGAGALGELFVKGTHDGLDSLDRVIRGNRSAALVKEISCIEAIEPVTSTYRRRGQESGEVLKNSPRRRSGFVTRVRLFNLGRDRDQEKIVMDFEAACRERKLYFSGAGYALSSFAYSVECRNIEDIEALSRIVGVRSLSPMPVLRALAPSSLNPLETPATLPLPEAGGDYPIVAVVDSGISDQVPGLGSWIVGRESYVAPVYRNPAHGTFVAGLICFGKELNPSVLGIGSEPCTVFDVQVFPNDDPSKGSIANFTESEFLQSLEQALMLHADRIKVWNFSMNTNQVCSLDEFSMLAEEMDNLQEKYEVSFVISAGNFTSPPLLDYPRTSAQIHPGRITPPADSVLGITVGSISHVNDSAAAIRKHDPSAFSRHGAGPNFIIKPDLVHYGGACSTDVSRIRGVRSLGERGTVEDFGTSFSTPLVARTLAQIYHQVAPTPRPVLAKALVVHHARDPRTSQRVPDTEENFFGFGLPAPVPYCLECSPHTSTLIFDDVLRPGYYLEWNDFPYPSSMKRGGRYFGEIWMTVAFSPARGGRWGTEYCETHIDAHFGVHRIQRNRETGKLTEKFVGLVPPEHKNPGVLYEAYQVAMLRKWSPVRTYHGQLGNNGQRGDRWRLVLRLLTRHGIEAGEAFRPQPFSLIMTISDPEGKAPVYDEMAQIIRNRFQSENLTVRAASRIRSNQ